MINGQTYYEILDLPKYGINDQGERVSLDTIHKKKQNFDFTLDKNMGELPPNLKMLKAAQRQEAYNVLSNNELRKEYDEKLKNGYFNNLGLDTHPINQEVKKEQTNNFIEEPALEEKEETPVKPEEPALEEEPTKEAKKPETKDVEENKNIEENIKNIIFDDETIEADAKIKTANRKRIINNSLIIGGSTILLGPIGTLISTIILKKKGKLKLQKLASKGRIKEIKTLESKIIEEETKNLENSIDELLNSSLKDYQSRYKLEIAKLKYENQIKLLEKRIEFKKGQKSQLGGKAYNRLYILALEMRFAAAIKSLEVRKKIAEAKLSVLKSYTPNKNKDDRLTKIQKEIATTKNQLEGSNLSNFRKNQKFAKINRLNTKKLQEIDKMTLKKDGISRNQVVLAVFNSAKNKVASLFSRKEEPTEETIDLMSSSKTVR